MIGKPKYKYGDKVKFSLNEEILEGTVYIIDKYGTWEDSSDVSYDILVETNKYITKENPKGECLYKHIKETLIIE